MRTQKHQPDAAQPERPGPLVKFGREVPPVRRVPIALARRFFQICMAAAAESTAAADLTPQEFAVMAYLNRAVGEPDIDQSSLAARLGIDHAHASLLVDRLESRGLLDRRVNGEDRRARLLQLTPRGEKLHARLYPEAFAGQHRILEVLKPSEREAFLDFLWSASSRATGTLLDPARGRRRRRPRRSPSHTT